MSIARSNSTQLLADSSSEHALSNDQMASYADDPILMNGMSELDMNTSDQESSEPKERDLESPQFTQNDESLPENIVTRKLVGYVGFGNLPRQYYDKALKKGFVFNLMIIGEAGLGKSTLINTLFNSPILKSKYSIEGGFNAEPGSNTIEIRTSEAYLQEDNTSLHLTVVDAPGFGDGINNEDAWRPIIKEIEARYSKYLDAESSIDRQNIRDERIHALLYVIQPSGHALTTLEIMFMKKVHQKVNLIPIIAKADSLNAETLKAFKKRILADIEYNKIEIWKPPAYESDDQETEQENDEIESKIPFAVIGSLTEFKTQDGEIRRGRKYPWGIILVDDKNVSDFSTLKQLLIRTHFENLKESMAKNHYEKFRTEKLLNQGIVQDESAFDTVDPAKTTAMKKQAHDQRIAKLEAEMDNVFSQKVSEKESKLKQSEDDLISKHREMKRTLERQRAELEQQKMRIENGLTKSMDGSDRKKFWQ